jgi:nucleotidyltransferase/DNA polymerase involved in DNA repair
MLVALKSIAESLWSHVERRGFSGRTLTLKVKFHDFRSVTRRRTVSHVFLGAEEFFCVGSELLLQTEASLFPVRLLGLSLSNLGEIEGTPKIETSCSGTEDTWPFCALDDKEGAKFR